MPKGDMAVNVRECLEQLQERGLLVSIVENKLRWLIGPQFKVKPLALLALLPANVVSMSARIVEPTVGKHAGSGKDGYIFVFGPDGDSYRLINIEQGEA